MVRAFGPFPTVSTRNQPPLTRQFAPTSVYARSRPALSCCPTADVSDRHVIVTKESSPHSRANCRPTSRAVRGIYLHTSLNHNSACPVAPPNSAANGYPRFLSRARRFSTFAAKDEPAASSVVSTHCPFLLCRCVLPRCHRSRSGTDGLDGSLNLVRLNIGKAIADAAPQSDKANTTARAAVVRQASGARTPPVSQFLRTEKYVSVPPGQFDNPFLDCLPCLGALKHAPSGACH